MIFSVETLFLMAMISIRLGGTFALLPFLGGRMIPAQVRMALVVLLSAILFPLVLENAEETLTMPVSMVGFFLSGSREFLVGMLMGLSARMIFFAVEFASQIIAMECSLSMSTALNPLSEVSATIFTPLLFYLTIILLFITGVDEMIILALLKSYDVMPVGAPLLYTLDIRELVSDASYVFTLGLKMAAPIVAISFIVNSVFAILGKTAPKVNVLMISFAVRIAAGLILLVFTMDLIVQYLFQQSRGIGEQMLQMLVQ